MPALMAMDRVPGTFAVATDVRGARWRHYAIPIADGAQYLIVSAPFAMIDASVAAFLRLVLFLIGLGVAASFGGGALVVGRARRPVATLTETANSIARLGSFNERVPASNRQDELGRLAATFNAMLASLERAYRAELEIHDTGVGIPAGDLENVFERFYRADQARSRDPGGTGLGLPIAQWITQQHGGEIALASELGRGTTVMVRLPVRTA
ncbi:MAG: HAMP domain-containing protein [Chloroflexi bacterium]|nr:HAMP domain-containing protein [Chloroflexota bacterium]